MKFSPISCCLNRLKNNVGRRKSNIPKCNPQTSAPPLHRAPPTHCFKHTYPGPRLPHPTYTYTHAHTYTYTHAHMYTYTHAHTCTYTRTSTRTRARTHARPHVNARPHVHVHARPHRRKEKAKYRFKNANVIVI